MTAFARGVSTLTLAVAENRFGLSILAATGSFTCGRPSAGNFTAGFSGSSEISASPSNSTSAHGIGAWHSPAGTIVKDQNPAGSKSGITGAENHAGCAASVGARPP